MTASIERKPLLRLGLASAWRDRNAMTSWNVAVAMVAPAPIIAATMVSEIFTRLPAERARHAGPARLLDLTDSGGLELLRPVNSNESAADTQGPVSSFADFGTGKDARRALRGGFRCRRRRAGTPHRPARPSRRRRRPRGDLGCGSDR